MNTDMMVPCGDGLINIRAGAIIEKDGKFLMSGNERADYLYSVGGRLKFGETAKEAVEREAFEETGVHLVADRLGFVQENYFIGDSPAKKGKEIYEISFYFYMKVPEDFEPACYSFTEDNVHEFLKWVSPDTDEKIFPAFFRTELKNPQAGVRYLIQDDRAGERKQTSVRLPGAGR